MAVRSKVLYKSLSRAEAAPVPGWWFGADWRGDRVVAGALAELPGTGTSEAAGADAFATSPVFPTSALALTLAGAVTVASFWPVSLPAPSLRDEDSYV